MFDIIQASKSICLGLIYFRPKNLTFSWSCQELASVASKLFIQQMSEGTLLALLVVQTHQQLYQTVLPNVKDTSLPLKTNTRGVEVPLQSSIISVVLLSYGCIGKSAITDWHLAVFKQTVTWRGPLTCHDAGVSQQRLLVLAQALVVLVQLLDFL